MRKLVTGFGIVLLVLFVAFSVGGDPFSDPVFAVQVLSFGLAGVLFLVGGLTDGISLGGRRIGWYVFFGIGISFVGFSFSFWLFVDPSVERSAGRVFARLLAIANAIGFGYMGFDTIRGNTYVDAMNSS